MAEPASPSPAATTADIRDIRGPVLIASPWSLVVPAVLAALALTVIAYVIVRRWRRRAASAPALPADAVALAELDRAAALIDPVNPRPFASRVSDVIRRYVESRFAASAPRRTTDEFLRELLRSPVAELSGHLSSLEEFLRQSDLVKFARHSPSREEMESMLHTARSFVETTRTTSEKPAARAAASR